MVGVRSWPAVVKISSALAPVAVYRTAANRASALKMSLILHPGPLDARVYPDLVLCDGETDRSKLISKPVKA